MRWAFFFFSFLFSLCGEAVQSFSSASSQSFSDLKPVLGEGEYEELQRAFPGLERKCSASLLSHSPDKVYHIQCPGKQLGLRIFGRTVYAQKRGAYRSWLAGELDFGPKVLYVSSDQKVVVWQWLEGKMLKVPLSQDDLRKMAHLLKEMHAVSKPKYLFPRVVKIENRVLHRIQDLKKCKKVPIDLKLLKKSVKLIGRYLKHSSKRMIHVDIHQKHVLKTPKGQLKLIDWGDSATGDPYDDLAAFSYFFCLSDSQEKEFLNLYLGRPATQAEQARLYLKKLLTLLHYSLWQLRQGLKGAGLLNQTHIGELPDSLQEWLCKNGENSHFSGNPALSKALGMRGLKDFFKEMSSDRYHAAVQVLKKKEKRFF